jgi:hypothetical protein
MQVREVAINPKLFFYCRGRRASTASCHPDVILLDEYRDDLVGHLRVTELPGDADLDLLAQEPDQLRAQGHGGDDRVVRAVGPRGGDRRVELQDPRRDAPRELWPKPRTAGTGPDQGSRT